MLISDKRLESVLSEPWGKVVPSDKAFLSLFARELADGDLVDFTVYVILSSTAGALPESLSAVISSGIWLDSGDSS